MPLFSREGVRLPRGEAPPPPGCATPNTRAALTAATSLPDTTTSTTPLSDPLCLHRECRVVTREEGVEINGILEMKGEREERRREM